MRADVAVIGAGTNGLAAAALLAKAGRKVVVLERRDVAGGLAAGEEFHPGWRTVGLLHDTTGLRPAVVEELELSRHGLELTAGSPAVFTAQDDGPGLLLASDPAEAAGEIRAHSERDASRYADWRAFLAAIRPFALRVLDSAPPDPGESRWELVATGWALRRLGKRTMREILRVGPMSAADWLGEWFESEALRAALAGPALAGALLGPRSPGSNANLLRREALAGPAVARGPRALVDALVEAADAQGVDVRLGARAESVRVVAGRVEGVDVAGGEPVDARVVVATCDPKTAILDLVGRSVRAAKLEQRVAAYRARGGTAKVSLALEGPLRFAGRPDLVVEHARTGATLDDLERAFDAAKYRRVSDPPVLDVHVPTVADPALAPAGGHVVSILARFVPHDLEGGWSDERRESLGDAVVAALERYVPDLRRILVAREVLTPVDLERRYGVAGGHLFHGEHALDQLLVRPTPECARYRTPIEGLWLGGGGTHPGGGITCGPGRLVAGAVLRSPVPA